MCIRLLLVLAASPLAAAAQGTPKVAPNAPPDRSLAMTRDCQLRALQKATEPLSERARASWPDARRRFVAGLGRDRSMFVTVRLTDSLHHMEQVFAAVDSVGDHRIFARVWSQLEVVQGFRYGQPIEIDESRIIDWMIANPDGSEEGNLVGKFIDTYRPPKDCGDT